MKVFVLHFFTQNLTTGLKFFCLPIPFKIRATKISLCKKNSSMLNMYTFDAFSVTHSLSQPHVYILYIYIAF